MSCKVYKLSWKIFYTLNVLIRSSIARKPDVPFVCVCVCVCGGRGRGGGAWFKVEITWQFWMHQNEQFSGAANCILNNSITLFGGIFFSYFTHDDCFNSLSFVLNWCWKMLLSKKMLSKLISLLHFNESELVVKFQDINKKQKFH